jgi:hypothetical protein
VGERRWWGDNDCTPLYDGTKEGGGGESSNHLGKFGIVGKNIFKEFS